MQFWLIFHVSTVLTFRTALTSSWCKDNWHSDHLLLEIINCGQHNLHHHHWRAGKRDSWWSGPCSEVFTAMLLEEIFGAISSVLLNLHPILFSCQNPTNGTDPIRFNTWNWWLIISSFKWNQRDQESRDHLSEHTNWVFINKQMQICILNRGS